MEDGTESGTDSAAEGCTGVTGSGVSSSFYWSGGTHRWRVEPRRVRGESQSYAMVCHVRMAPSFDFGQPPWLDSTAADEGLGGRAR